MRKAIVVYTPAIHAGYLKFFQQPGVRDIYLIDKELAKELIPRLERDIRALDATETAALLSGLFKELEFIVLGKKNIKKILAGYDRIIVPNEDVSVEITKRFLAGKDKNIDYIDIFLRWDMTNSVKAAEPRHDYETSATEINKKLMLTAQSEAQNSSDWWRQVGSLLVKDGKVFLKSHNQSYPSKNYSVEVFGDPRSNFDAGQSIELSKFIHAEAFLISLAAKKGLKLEGAGIFVTTFPCPVCSKLIANAGITEVYFKDGYSLLDAEDIFKAKKIKIIKIV